MAIIGQAFDMTIFLTCIVPQFILHGGNNLLFLASVIDMHVMQSHCHIYIDVQYFIQ